MMGSGHLTGYLVNDRVVQDQIVQALETLASPDEFREKYGVPENKGVLLFAMGDGNHSLATAKAIWEKIKVDVGTDHPSRYALVEIENVHDEALTFEPIHRIVFSVQEDVLSALKNYFGNNIRYSSKKDASFVIEHVNNPFRDDHSFGLIGGSNSGIITIPEPTSNLPVGSLQTFLDSWLQNGKAKGIDYVHGEEIVRTLGTKPGNVGFYLPAMKKGDLFKTVILDGSLPRKTFSMGEAKDKRFYMECRKIS
jgi:uncharacterized protein (DUF1015 family)